MARLPRHVDEEDRGLDQKEREGAAKVAASDVTGQPGPSKRGAEPAPSPATPCKVAAFVG